MFIFYLYYGTDFKIISKIGFTILFGCIIKSTFTIKIRIDMRLTDYKQVQI